MNPQDKKKKVPKGKMKGKAKPMPPGFPAKKKKK
jgi:hypothetical protein